ncbi:MAG: hypothetical protein J6V33_02385 [Bacteroidales bacterium]|nr:hypothetical protein [Bacteroidales bacterium]
MNGMIEISILIFRILVKNIKSSYQNISNRLKILLTFIAICNISFCQGDTVSIHFRFYHSDHLGSASWITNGSGTPVQHLQYMPYGEPFVNERTSSYEERYTFTGKERDSETGYSYFGARFYDSDLMTGLLSVDPQSDKFPNISPYNYCNWNPVRLVDPDGEVPVKPLVSAGKVIYKAYKIYRKTGNLTMKSLKKAGLDELVGIVDDINTIFSGDASLTDRIAAGVDLLVGTELNNKTNIVKKSADIGEMSVSAIKNERKFNCSKSESKYWRSLKNEGNGRKSSGKGKKKQYYEWDYTHNDIEVYNHRGEFIGSADPITGDIYKPVNAKTENRTIDI